MIQVSAVNSPNKGKSWLRDGSAQDMFISCCTCALMETVQSIGVGMKVKETRGLGIHSLVWSLVSLGVWNVWPIDRCSKLGRGQK